MKFKKEEKSMINESRADPEKLSSTCNAIIFKVTNIN